MNNKFFIIGVILFGGAVLYLATQKNAQPKQRTPADIGKSPQDLGVLGAGAGNVLAKAGLNANVSTQVGGVIDNFFSGIFHANEQNNTTVTTAIQS